MMRYARVLTLLSVAVVVTTGCGGGQSSNAASGTTSATATATSNRKPTVPTQVQPASASTRSAAKRRCKVFKAETADFETSTGLPALIKQIRVFRRARSDLASALERDATAEDEAGIRVYTAALRAGNVTLASAEEAAGTEQVALAYDRLGRWQEGLREETRLVTQLKLAGCPR